MTKKNLFLSKVLKTVSINAWQFKNIKIKESGGKIMMKKNLFLSKVLKTVSMLVLVPFVLSTHTYYITDTEQAIKYTETQSHKLHTGYISDDILDDPEISDSLVRARTENARTQVADMIVEKLIAKIRSQGLEVSEEAVILDVMGSLNRKNIELGKVIPGFNQLAGLLEKKLRDTKLSGIDKSDTQLTWVTGPYTDIQLRDAQHETKRYLGNAGQENRIFDVTEISKSLTTQVAAYAARRTDPDRGLPFWKKGTEEDPEEQDKLIERLRMAKEFHDYVLSEMSNAHLREMGASDSLHYSAEQHLVLSKQTRLAFVFDEDGNPSFYQEGRVPNPKFLAITASSGGYRYDGFKKSDRYNEGRDARSIYLNLSNVEGYMELAQQVTDGKAIYLPSGQKLTVEDIQNAYLYRILHEHFELKDRKAVHRLEKDGIAELINFVDKKIFEAWHAKRQEALKKQIEADKNKVIAEVTSANITKFLIPETDGTIDKTLITTAEYGLRKLVEEGILVDYYVFANGGDIHIYTTRLNKNTKRDERVLPQKLIEVYTRVLETASTNGLLSKPVETLSEFKALGLEEKTLSLEIRRTFKPLIFSERKAEPIAVLSAAHTYIGAFNQLICEVLMNPSTNAGLIIDPEGYRGYIIEIWDSVEDKAYMFDSITEHTEIRVLASQPGRYAIVGAYTKKEHKAGDFQPVIAVSCKRISDDGKRYIRDDSPVLLMRAQSGLPAWGEVIEGFAKAKPILTYGGNETPWILAWRPTDINEAATIKRSEMGYRSILAGIGYQSHEKGRIGIAEDVGGDKTLNEVRDNADKWSEHFTNVPEELDLMKMIEPYKRPHVYDRPDMVQETYERLLETRFKDNPPKPTEEELAQGERYNDPILYGKKQDLTISNIKADVGSVPGHFKPHPIILAAADELLNIASELGTNHVSAYIKWLNKYHRQPLRDQAKEKVIDGFEYASMIHQLSLEFISEIKKGANADEKFKKEMADIASELELANDTRIKKYKVWYVGDDVQLTMFHDQEVEYPSIHEFAFIAFNYAVDSAEFIGLYGRRQDLLVDRLVSGNIQGAGPGYAEIQVKEGESVLLLSADKSAPGAFTNPLIAWARKAIKQGKFKNGLIFEIWDINHSKRAFLDMTDEKDFKDAVMLLSAPEEFATKRVWETKTRWDGKSPIEDILAEAPIASASTERLVLTAGEYVGKDDPTLLIKISEHGFEYEDLVNIFNYPLTASGWMRGSHNAILMPDVQEGALPHRFDGPPPITGYKIEGVKKDGSVKSFDEVFEKSEALEKVHEMINFIGDVLRRQGWLPPHRVEGPDTEYSTFRDMIAALKAKGRAKKASDEAQIPFDKAIQEEPVRAAVSGYQGYIDSFIKNPSTIWVESNILSGNALIEERQFLSQFTNGKTTLRTVGSLKDIPTSGKDAFTPGQDVIVLSQTGMEQLNTSGETPDFLANAYAMPPVEVGENAHPYIREILIGARLLPEIKKSDIPKEGQISKSKAYNALRNILTVLTKTNVTTDTISALLPNPNVSALERLRQLLKVIVRYLPLNKYDRNQIEHLREFLWSA